MLVFENLALLPAALNLCFFGSSPQGNKDSTFGAGAPPSLPRPCVGFIPTLRPSAELSRGGPAAQRAGPHTRVWAGLLQTQVCLCPAPACRALTRLCPTASRGTPSPTDWIESTRCSATGLLWRSKCQRHSFNSALTCHRCHLAAKSDSLRGK